MSTSKWRWTRSCDGDFCPGDCDFCAKDNELTSAEKKYIDLDVLDVISYTGTEGRPDTFDDGVMWVLEYIDRLPAADVELVRHGRWHDIYQITTLSFTGICSVCGSKSQFFLKDGPSKRCPKCGAKME